MTQNTCPAHENVVLKINSLEERSKNMSETISGMKKNDQMLTDKLDNLALQLNSLIWKLIGAVGAMILIAQLIINFVK